MSNKTGFYEGKIYIDDKEETINNIIKNSWYVGYDIYASHKPLRRKTIKEQIKAGVRTAHYNLNADAIQNMFEVSEAEAKRSINKVGVEQWKASAAIGYAYGRKVFCYPWMNSGDVERLREQLTKSIKVLIDNNCIVVFPTTKEENIMKLSAKYNIVKVD